jgi:hypothetical protein
MMFNVREAHHLYWGVGLIALGAALWLALPWPWCLLAVPIVLVGSWCAVDDIYQHVRQLWQPDYQSSLHRWFVRELYPNPIVRKLNIWLDHLFGA